MARTGGDTDPVHSAFPALCVHVPVSCSERSCFQTFVSQFDKVTKRQVGWCEHAWQAWRLFRQHLPTWCYLTTPHTILQRSQYVSKFKLIWTLYALSDGLQWLLRQAARASTLRAQTDTGKWPFPTYAIGAFERRATICTQYGHQHLQTMVLQWPWRRGCVKLGSRQDTEASIDGHRAAQALCEHGPTRPIMGGSIRKLTVFYNNTGPPAVKTGAAGTCRHLLRIRFL